MNIKIALDPTNFPMIWIEAENGGFYMHWLPFTKIQIEYFLSIANITSFPASWYDEVLQYNERISPSLITSQNYWQAFVTGVKPSEIKQFIAWFGSQYRLPMDDEWQAAYRFLKKNPENRDFINEILETPGLNRRARTLIKNIQMSLDENRTDLRGGRAMADQALMRLGIMEYVYLDDRRNSYGGYGQPNANFFGSTVTPDRGYPERLVDAHNGAKMPHYGFRLIRQG